ncbi:S41 family peptidase [Gramella jeungdoensis]|uniref:S41 family peptidase n=1 Tax=Gramella jeungdoensis TaxID=708091 RepID=A0ABT0Z4Y3_9FLAO|nr:S41 family peptidase [Gramella jeungdoensis]MCM8570801.1 S41 family peptidase [Gramella jeungdoensis]
MKVYKYLMLFLLTGGMLVSCSKDDNDDIPNPPDNGGKTEVSLELEIKDFVWKGMNEIYLYKSDIPELANDYFADQEELYDWLETWDTPENLFYDGLVASQDRFSFITDDYIELENSFSGISETTGVDYRLYRLSSGSNDIFGVVRYIIPGSNAEGKDIQRGDLFTKINGEALTISNYRDLLSNSTITFTLAKIENNTISETGETVTIDAQTLTENPILINKVLDVDGIKVGYLMYNSFVADFDDELNTVFADFKAAGIQKLILDLRYNGGGRVSSATRLASMITGQFTGEVFAKQQWNDKYQNYFLQENPDRLFNYFTDKIDNNEAINSLNLSDVYVIGTSSTASASELVMNGLSPYIDVIKVGDTTVGKSQASVTLYDSPNFGRENANPDHKYAIQPLVYESVNAEDMVVPYNGIIPDFAIEERISNMGTLGDPSERLLSAAIDAIAGSRRFYPEREFWYNEFKEAGFDNILYQRMYIDKLPDTGGRKLGVSFNKE